MFEKPLNSVTRVKAHPAQSPPAPRIIDIRAAKRDIELREALQQSIHSGSTALPDLLLWDEQGLRLFEEVTYCPSYYLTGEEISLLEKNRLQIANHIPDGSMLVELGSGGVFYHHQNLRKTKILLDALEELGRRVDYFALDLSYSELARTLRPVSGLYRHVNCYGLLGTYDDGRRWLQHPNLRMRPKTILFLGSTLGNMEKDDAAGFLNSFTDVECGLLLGLDGCKREKEVLAAYDDPEGINHRFVKNGLVRANRILGKEALELHNWDVQGGWDAENGVHTQYYSPSTDTFVEGVRFRAGHRLVAARSHKYDASDRDTLFKRAGLTPLDSWSSEKQYNLLYLRSA
ncbi:histidine-specific methyltransferase [Aspergillus undulatus]|uniref:histidine-specific methyltransferase n=1 Tax=Aspergillus undulatus TaxID=1810928 RepID=UPI003CCE0C32